MPPFTVASLATIDAFAPGDAADAGDDAGRRNLAAVHPVRGELRQFEERRARIDQRGDPVARQQLVAREVPLARGLAAAKLRRRPRARAGLRRGRASRLRWRRTRRNAGRCRNGSWSRGRHPHPNPPPLRGRGCGELPLPRSGEGLGRGCYPHHAVSRNSSRPISMRRISLVPAPISYSLASRSSRPVG